MTQRPDQIRAVFGENLAELVKSERSVADLARKLGMNRTQLMRFIAGTAFPRPDVLHQICDYFKVDARIFTTSLQKLREPEQVETREALGAYFDPTFAPVSHDLLPDGLYEEWKTSISMPGMISQHMMRIYTQNGRRLLKLKARNPELISPKEFRYTLPMNVFHGQIFAQRAGFATIDRTPSQRVIALTSYRVGYSIHEHLYPGYKLAGASYNQRLVHSHGPVVLQLLQGTKQILAAGREPQYRPTMNAPPLICKILHELATEAFYHGGLPFSPPHDWLGGPSGH